MRRSEGLGRLAAPKAAFAGALVRNLETLPRVRSATFTGSFIDRAGLEGISDIDLVVVVDVLDETIFSACRNAVSRVSPSELGLPDHRLLINDTYGPLKFDEAGIVVVHLMLYDLASHREHVLKSPFTCLDWERSQVFAGLSLRAIFPVLQLQPRHFLDARRSLTNYLEDIVAGSISYRRLDFASGGVSEIQERLPLDRRHQGEYAYHIVRNLVANYAKLVLGENRHFTTEALQAFWQKHLPGCGAFIPWFNELTAVKLSRQSNFPADTPDRTREFLAAFSQEVDRQWSRGAYHHGFYRHARTSLNDGTFLGQRRDPGIAAIPPPERLNPARIYSSPSRRGTETAAALFPGQPVQLDDRLKEIDYGKAEGWRLTELNLCHPEMTAAWARGEDPLFPDGENHAAVLTRLSSFLQDLPTQACAIITHNVVIRCLAGSLLGLPASCWHRIPIEHLERFDVIQSGAGRRLDLSSEQIARFSDALAGYLP